MFKLVLTSKNTVEKLEGYTVTEVQEVEVQSLSITPGINNSSQKFHRDNADHCNHTEKKRKLTTQGENLEYDLATLNEARKVVPELEETERSTTDLFKTPDVFEKADDRQSFKRKN